MNNMNKKLKILHVVPTLKKDGAEVQLSTLFKNFQHTDIDLFTFDMYPNGDSVIDNLNQIKVMTSKSFFGFVYLNNLIRNNDYDFVHSHLPKSDIIVGIICKLNKVSNHIISVHAQYGTRKGENKIKYKLTEKIWKWVVNSSVGVIAISEKIKTWLISEKEISEEIISVIHYGVEIKNRETKISNNNSIGMAARILPWKGWDKVLETALFLKQKGVQFNLKLAGSDDEGYLKNIKNIITKYDLNDQVKIFDQFTNIEDFFEEIDLFLFLSESEGFGLVVLEAIENNVAVVCSDISPLNEFVENVSGCLVNREQPEKIADVIRFYFEDGQKQLNVVKQKQKQNIIDNFSIKKAAEKVEKFYINAINV